ncbi:DEAD/DEAH box helicase family protein [Paeniglutamicibacter psychrophenolicus]|uniref:DEAD/DEAH box helicase family protein n=1 Tax=Paeniglutamicibacter psychrophenolicus TaxID=257454 RepID=UPI0027801269|nr:DEAD/DEAH box helicase family protein [Paeniglutamicibacter psychrophenolicus]MDQ0093065.1 superfamily II DNA or RNA helicase [Paeniglutamicibacter psychrophenolicus]
MSSNDADGLVYGYAARNDTELSEMLRCELRDLLASPAADGAKLFAALVANGLLDLRLAKVALHTASSSKSMFHDKVGLFRDSAGDSVGFRGSLNETYLGLSRHGNIESIDVWPSWAGGRDAERVAKAVGRFEDIWDSKVPGVTVVGLPDDIRREIEIVAKDVDLEAFLRDASVSKANAAKLEVGGIELRDHQGAAFRAWQANGHQGIFAHATGSGKSVSGLYCAQQAIRGGLIPIILVPSKLLLEQWAVQAREVLGAKVISVGAGHNRWRTAPILRAAMENHETNRPYVIVAVLNSASTPMFRAQVQRGVDKAFVLFDESHRAGSLQYRELLEWLTAPQRLGLSATPNRANDPEGTLAVSNYFDGTVHRYTLKNALDDGVLAKYEYHPQWVSLTEEEQERWDILTTEIRRRTAMDRSSDATAPMSDQLKMKLIERARIAKSASRKIPAAIRTVVENYKPDEKQKWLIYCDNQVQVEELRVGLNDLDITAWAYHSAMTGDPINTLRMFDSEGGIIISIKCLDEGVDIPSATHALVIASSRNEREFIQRRGRILRKAPNKTIATLVDILVLPDEVQRTDSSWPLVVGELARASQFAAWGLNTDSVSKIEAKIIDMGIQLEELSELMKAGYEEDEESIEGD